MISNSKKDGFDQDFLWLFREVERAAICVSADYQVIEITSVVPTLFRISRTEILGQDISLLFAPVGLKISFPKDNGDPVISITQAGVANSFKESTSILNLTWKIRPKISMAGKIIGFVIYAKGQETFTQLPKIPGKNPAQDRVAKESCKNELVNKGYLATMIAYLPGNIYWLDKNLVFLGCNDHLVEFLGLHSKKETLGATYDDLEKKSDWIAAHVPLWKQHSLEVLATGKPKLNIEGRSILMPDGKELFYLTNHIPLFDDGNNIVGVATVVNDISALKIAKKLQKERDLAEKNSKFMLLLSANIAHEVKAPLSIIALNVDLLTMKSHIFENTKEKAIIKKNFADIRYAVKFASSTINNILVMLKTVSNKDLMKGKFVRLAIIEDIRYLLDIYPFLEREKSLVQVQLNEMKDFIYQGDKILTQQVLYSLLRYSLYDIKAEGRGKIEITLDERKNYHILKFTHTASSIPKEMLPKMFNQFELENADNSGTGLGLAFCKVVMGSYGGDIVCRSRRVNHTEFVLSFPK